MTRNVLCDRCEKDAGYENDFKCPPWVRKTEVKDTVYDVLVRNKYIDLCQPCFDLFHNRYDLAIEKLFAEFKNIVWLTEKQKELALADAIAKAENAQSFYEDFAGKNCEECPGWKVGERRCECGNRRICWEYIQHNDGTFEVWPEAY